MRPTYATFFILALLPLFVKPAAAQPKFPNLKATIEAVQCNYNTLGSITLHLDSANAPYTYKWNNGQAGNAIKALMPGSYTVKINNKKGEDTSATFIIKEPECEIRATLVFTPNGDGHRDTWGISNMQYFQNAWVIVYNRLGQKVFEHNGLYKPWDGNDLLGNALPEGTYYYVIYENKKEKKIVKGSVSILR